MRKCIYMFRIKQQLLSMKLTIHQSGTTLESKWMCKRMRLPFYFVQRKTEICQSIVAQKRISLISSHNNNKNKKRFHMQANHIRAIRVLNTWDNAFSILTITDRLDLVIQLATSIVIVEYTAYKSLFFRWLCVIGYRYGLDSNETLPYVCITYINELTVWYVWLHMRLVSQPVSQPSRL